MFVILDGERLEPPLPDMPRGSIVPMISADVRRHQPLHPSTQIAIAMRPQDQMEVVRHQAQTRYPQREALTRVSDQVQERLVVFGLMEDLRPPIAPIDHVIAIPTHRSPRHTKLQSKVAA